MKSFHIVAPLAFVAALGTTVLTDARAVDPGAARFLSASLVARSGCAALPGRRSGASA